MRQENGSKRVMVLLVGGRLTPNFIGVLGYKPDIIECIVSQDEQEKFEDIREVLSPLPNVKLSSPPYYVAAFDMQQTLEACKRIITVHQGAEIIFNVTCATKVMAIAAYEAARQKNCSAIYVDTAHGRFLNLTSPGEQAIPIRIGLRDYLSFYGRQPQKSFEFKNLSVSKDKAIEVANYLANAGVNALNTLIWMRKYSPGKGRRTIRAKCKRPLESNQWEVLCQLNKLGLISNLQKISETEISYLIARDHDWKFLDGTWLEVYVWHQAEKCIDEEGGPLFDECDFSIEILGKGGANRPPGKF